jgi:hypothetical protein
LGLACASKSKKEDHKSGRLNYVETPNYGPAGVHGQPGWYVVDRNFYVNDKRWSPPGIKVKDIGSCYPGPNPTVEALMCHSFAEMKQWVFVLHMKDDQPEWVTAFDAEIGSGNDGGEWVGDGHWLLFRDYYLDHKDAKVRAAAVSGLTQEDVRELLPRIQRLQSLGLVETSRS